MSKKYVKDSQATRDVYVSTDKSKNLKEAYSYEPKLDNRFIVYFKEPFEKIQRWTLKSTSRPKLIGGKWQNITLVLNDVIAPSTAQAVMEGILTQQERCKDCSMDFLYDLHLLDSVGDVIEEWNIHGAIISVDFGELGWDKGDILTIKLVIEPLKVMLRY